METTQPNPTWNAAAHSETVDAMEAAVGEVTYRIWGADWCGDCRATLPDFFAALEVIEEYTSIGRHYVVLGDPGVTVAQCVDGVPVRYELDRRPVSSSSASEDDELDLTAVGHTTRRYPMGSVQQLYLRPPDAPDFHLAPGPTETYANEEAEVKEAVGSYSVPLVAEGELLWSDQLFGDGTE